MIVVTVLVVAFAAGADPRRLALLAGAIYLPLVAAVLIGLHWLRARPDESSRPAVFCAGVAAELRAGTTLREALLTSAASAGISPLTPEQSAGPILGLAAHIAGQVPAIHRELELTVIAASRSGSDSAALFDEIGALAIAKSEMSREVTMATAPGRATAMVLVGAPVLYLGWQVGGGGLGELLATSEQRIVAILGLGLFVIGAALAALVLWRAAR